MYNSEFVHLPLDISDSKEEKGKEYLWIHIYKAEINLALYSEDDEENK